MWMLGDDDDPHAPGASHGQMVVVALLWLVLLLVLMPRADRVAPEHQPTPREVRLGATDR